MLPRHRHNVDYIELLLKGEVHHGNRVIREGEGVHRSGHTPYTPYTFTVGPRVETIADLHGHAGAAIEYVDPPEQWSPHALPLSDETVAPSTATLFPPRGRLARRAGA